MYVQSEASFKLPKKELLDLIRKPGALELYHPFCKKNEVITWPGSNSMDKVLYFSGLEYTREIFNWHKNGYDLRIGAKRRDTIVNWIVSEKGGISTLKVRVNPSLPYKNPLIKWLAWNLYVKHKLQSYIESVMMGFKYYLDNKKRVEANQFGKHSWFS